MVAFFGRRRRRLRHPRLVGPDRPGRAAAGGRRRRRRPAGGSPAVNYPEPGTRRHRRPPHGGGRRRRGRLRRLPVRHRRGQGRSLRPYVHDEFSYLIQAHQFARGRLWFRPHPLAPFFDSFQLFVAPSTPRPTSRARPCCTCRACGCTCRRGSRRSPWPAVVAGLLFRVAAELFDGVGAVVAVAPAVGRPAVPQLSTMVLGQMPLLMYGLVAAVAWLAWRATDRRRWLALAGAALALAAVTRPVDAVCFVAPVGAGRRLVRRRPPAPAGSAPAALAVPVLLVQLTLEPRRHRPVVRDAVPPVRRPRLPRHGLRLPAVRPRRPAGVAAAAEAGAVRRVRPPAPRAPPGTIVVDQFRTHGPLRPARLPVTLSQLTCRPVLAADRRRARRRWPA